MVVAARCSLLEREGERCEVEGASDAWPAARATSRAAGLAALPIERRQAGKGCNLSAGKGPSSGMRARRHAATIGPAPGAVRSSASHAAESGEAAMTAAIVFSIRRAKAFSRPA
jgi:hypothetical protein